MTSGTLRLADLREPTEPMAEDDYAPAPPEPRRRKAVLVETVDGREVLTTAPNTIGLFVSARNAIRFAVTREGAPARPPASRMLDAMTGARDFAGLDGAAQAGMILNIIEAFGKMEFAALVAGSAPARIPCTCRRPCCSGSRLNQHWYAAIDALAQGSTEVCKARTSYALRSALLVKLFAGGKTLKEIGEECGVSEETATRRHSELKSWLQGHREKGRAFVKGLEQRAWAQAEAALASAGIVGNIA
jgi:hypothetical protein